MIYHMTPTSCWQQAEHDSTYACDSLSTEGFIHCTREPDRLLRVANQLYRHEKGKYVILCINEAKVAAEIRWEAVDDHLFPHIYGSLNKDAVEHVVDFPRNGAGTFESPPL